MTGYQSMVSKLAPLRLYNITEHSEIGVELSVIAEEIDAFYEYMDEVLREMFIATAQSWGISGREKFICKEKSDLTLEKRRELLETAGYITGIDNTPSGFEAFVRSCGVQDFTYTEVYQHSRITLTVNDQLDSGTKLMLEERLDAYIPANWTPVRTSIIPVQARKSVSAVFSRCTPTIRIL